MGASADSPLVELIFTRNVTAKRDSMFRSLLGEGYVKETIFGEIEGLRWRARRPPPDRRNRLQPAEEQAFGSDASVVEDEILGWKLRAILAADGQSLYVTAIDDPRS